VSSQNNFAESPKKEGLLTYLYFLLMKKILIAIDGYSGCGKSSTAKSVAEALDYVYIDTGAMYRAVTLYLLDNQIDIENAKEVESKLSQIQIDFRINPLNKANEVHLNGKNVENDIRQMRVSEAVSEVSGISQVRRFLVAQQQKMGENKGMVLDGRDIGTVVFPQAELKIFMTANISVRAKRRLAETQAKGQEADLEAITENIQKRDFLDTTRKDSPLRKAEGAVIVDTSFISFAEQVNKVLELAKKLL
jgi:CMP/dCMP kinase